MAKDGIMADDEHFQIFPREIWDMILEQVEDSMVIVHIIQIYPQLKELSRGNEFSWLIGDVMPFILPKFLNFNKDIKSCRLVSKRWKNAFENTYQTHPDRLPYNSANLTKVTEHHFSYHPLPQFKINIRRLIETGMRNGCSQNPFPGGFLKIKIDVPENRNSYNVSVDKVLQMLEMLGQHVYYTRFVPSWQGKWEKDVFVQEYLNNVLKCIVHMPNLRSLSLEGFSLEKSTQVPETSAVSIESMSPIPVLAHLEMVDMSTNLWEISKHIFHHILTGLVKGGRIKMLGLYHQYWDTRYKDMFPDLTELRITAGRDGGEETVGNLLQDLHAPYLRKLSLDFDKLGIEDLTRILAPYQIETLEICGRGLYEADVYDHVVPSINHFKFMTVPYSEMLFLKMFPNLENLSIKYDDGDSDGWEEEDELRDPENVFARGILHFLLEFKYNLSQRDIVWESFPELKMITVHGNPIRYYLRENPNKVYRAYNSNLAAVFSH